MTQPDLTFLVEELVVRPGVAPGASFAYSSGRGERWVFGEGAAGVRSALRPTVVTPATLYDLASVTKPFVAVAFARLLRRRLVDADCPLAALVDEARGSPSAGVPLELFFAHRAGLGAHQELFAALREGREVEPAWMLERAAHARREECTGPPPEVGFPPIYSDLGYLLAGVALERAAGAPLDDVVRREVVEPLGLEIASVRQWQRQAPERIETVAPTEVVAFRGGEVAGAVHDENAWAFARTGLAGHAGLFGTAGSVARFGSCLIDALAGRLREFLEPAEVERLVRPRPGGSLRAGFDGKSGLGSSAGSRFGPHAFGHLGYTGTSLWCDPEARIVAVALTNRVSPTREHWAIREARPLIHDALFEAAEKQP